MNARDILGGTPLHYAAVYSGELEIVKYLVGQGANVNARDKLGRTPRDRAESWDHTAIAEYLESLGG